MVEQPLAEWRVLVVDDEEDSLEVAKMMLEIAGASVLTASDGQQALQLIKATKPHFILSDLSMPVMDGWQLMHRLVEDRSTQDIPVIALTAHAMKGDRERAMAAGFRNYITKPLDASKFMGQLLAILITLPEFTDSFV